MVGKKRGEKGEKKSLMFRRGNERGFLDTQKSLGLDAKRSRLTFWREINFGRRSKIRSHGSAKMGSRATPIWSCP